MGIFSVLESKANSCDIGKKMFRALSILENEVRLLLLLYNIALTFPTSVLKFLWMLTFYTIHRQSLVLKCNNTAYSLKLFLKVSYNDISENSLILTDSGSIRCSCSILKKIRSYTFSFILGVPYLWIIYNCI